MRCEQDSLGEMQLPDEAYYGIATARLLKLAALPGPAFPPEVASNIIRVRQAQAIAFGRNKTWRSGFAEVVAATAGRIAIDRAFLSAQIKILPVHGGGARGVVLNTDEVLSNVVIEEIGGAKGQYHLVGPLLQMDRGAQHLSVYMTAVHIALISELNLLDEELKTLLERLQEQEQRFTPQETLLRSHYQDIAFSNIGTEFSRYHESLSRCRQQLEGFRLQLGACWQGPNDVLPLLKELVGMNLTASTKAGDFPWNTDLYLGIAAVLRTSAISQLQFCDRVRQLVGGSKEMELPKIRANPPFSPTAREFLIPDTVSQLCFLIIGGDATIAAAAGMNAEGAGSYAPLFTVQLLHCAKWASQSICLQKDGIIAVLSGNAAWSEMKKAASPLQAEGLIALLGFEQSVQVARIAALTEKPVRLVVEKMKLLSEEQIKQIFPSKDEAVNGTEEEETVKKTR